MSSRPYISISYSGALQFIPAPIVRKHFYTCHQKVCNLPANLYHITPICIDTNSCYITLICIYLYIIINTPNETEYAYSLELELNPTFCRSVLWLVFFVIFSSPGQSPCELLPSLGVRRLSYVVNFHIYIFSSKIPEPN